MESPNPEQRRRPAAQAAILAAATRAAAAVLLALAAAGPAGPAGAGEAHLEPPGGTRGYDVLDYDLDLELLIAERAVRGAVTIEMRAVEAPLARVRLDLHGALAVDSLRWRGEPAAWTHAGDSLVVEPPAPLPAGEIALLRVVYQGRPPQNRPPLGAGLMFRAHGDETPDPADDAPVVASVSQPSNAHTWWPCKDHPSDKATATIAVTVPDTLTVVANGRLLSTSPAPPARRRFVWREDYPIAPYLVAVAVSNYVSWTQTCDTAAGPLPLGFHAFPQDQARMRADLEPTCAMLCFLEEIAGPYPFPADKYDQVEIRWGAAMENQTVTALGQFLLTGDGRNELWIVHELAHQWFGNLVTPARWQEIWLSEGFARYAEALWLERRRGREAYLDYLAQIGPRRHPDLFTQAGTLADPSPILPNPLVYDKGAWLLHMLRGRIGDGPFFALLRAWTSAPQRAYGNAATADLVAAASAVAGEDLGPWFDPWLRSAAVPELAWSWRAARRPGGGARVTLELQQMQGPLFLLDLPVRLEAEGRAREVMARLAARAGRFVWDVDLAVETVRLDPDGWLLWRSAGAPAPPLELLGIDPRPVRHDGARVRFRARGDGAVAASLYDARGRALGRWRLEAAAGDAGERVWQWDGRDGRGRPLLAGVYWLELRADGGGRAVGKLAHIP